MAESERKKLNIIQRLFRAVGNFFYRLSGEEKTREKERAELQDKIEELSEELKKSKEEKDRLEKEREKEIKELFEELLKAKEEKDRLEKEKQKVEIEALKKEIEKEKEERKREREILKELFEAEKKKFEVEKEKAILETENKFLKEKIEEQSQKIEKLEGKIEELERIIKELQEMVEKPEEEIERELPQAPIEKKEEKINICEYADAENLLADIFNNIAEDNKEELTKLAFYFNKSNEDLKEIINYFAEEIITELEKRGFDIERLKLFLNEYAEAVLTYILNNYASIKSSLRIDSSGIFSEEDIVNKFYGGWDNYKIKMREAFLRGFFRIFCENH